jgi:circadian clock protein KaiB
MAKKYILKLYITGDTVNSQRAIKNLRSIAEAELKGLYELEIIDVLKDPEPAMEDKILATPTLIKVSPGPTKRIIGDLSDKQKLLPGLDLDAEPQKLISEKLQSIHEEACIRTSDALAKLIGGEAIVDIVNPVVKKVEELTPTIGSDRAVVIVCLSVSRKVKGAALLMFSNQTAFYLSDLLIKKASGTTKELTELDKSALLELGNIICGSYFTTLSNYTGIKMIEQAPRLSFDTLETTLEQAVRKLTQNQEDVVALETEFNFTVPAFKGHLFKSYFLVLFQTRHLEVILDSLQQVTL